MHLCNITSPRTHTLAAIFIIPMKIHANYLGHKKKKTKKLDKNNTFWNYFGVVHCHRTTSKAIVCLQIAYHVSSLLRRGTEPFNQKREANGFMNM